MAMDSATDHSLRWGSSLATVNSTSCHIPRRTGNSLRVEGHSWTMVFHPSETPVNPLVKHTLQGDPYEMVDT